MSISGDRPYVRLFTQLGVSPAATRLNALTGRRSAAESHEYLNSVMPAAGKKHFADPVAKGQVKLLPVTPAWAEISNAIAEVLPVVRRGGRNAGDWARGHAADRSDPQARVLATSGHRSLPGQPLRGARPYVKLFTLTGGGTLADTSEAHLRFIAETYGWINSHGGSWRWPVTRAEVPFGRSGGMDASGRTAGDVLRAHNPSIILTNYCNGSYSNQEGLREALQAERRLPLAIAVHHTGARLVSPLGTDETSVSLRPPTEVPAGQPPIYPFKASTTEQEHTADKRRYVAWLRLDDEILRIDAARFADGLIRLSVRRGTWGTVAAPHAAETPVLQPVYCGSLRPDGGEYYLSGLPDGTSPQPALRYVFMQQRRAFWDFLAERIQETLDEGLDGPWLDCAVSSWINHANAYGARIKAPYDLDLDAPLDRETHRQYQQRKLDHLAERFPGGELYVNWFFPRHYSANGHERLLLSGENGYRPIAGGAIEMYANEHFMDWHDLMAMHLDMRDRRFRVVSWIKRADVGKSSDRDVPADYQLFGYATHLLVYEPDAPLYFGAAWQERGAHGIFTPPDFVYWDLGQPLQRFGAIAEAELPDAPGVYARRFSNGMVLVNPDLAERREVTLSDPLFDIRADGSLAPPQPRLVLAPLSAKLLLRPTSCGAITDTAT